MNIDSKQTIKTACGDNLYYWVLFLCMGSICAMIPAIALRSATGNAFWNGLAQLAAAVVAVLLLRRRVHRQQAKGLLYTTVDSVDDAVLAHDRRLGLVRILVVMFIVLAYSNAWNGLFGLVERGLNVLGYTASSASGLFSDYGDAIPELLYVGIVGPIAEELVWRGFIMRGLQPVGRNLAIVLSALMFGLMHGNLYQIPFAFGIGLMLGYVAMEYSIYDAMILHVINNSLFNIGLIYLNRFNGTLANVVGYGGTIVGAVIIVYLLVRYHGSIREYIAAGHAEKGTARYVWNIWFILFLIAVLAASLLTIQPL